MSLLLVSLAAAAASARHCRWFFFSRWFYFVGVRNYWIGLMFICWCTRITSHKARSQRFCQSYTLNHSHNEQRLYKQRTHSTAMQMYTFISQSVIGWIENATMTVEWKMARIPTLLPLAFLWNCVHQSITFRFIATCSSSIAIVASWAFWLFNCRLALAQPKSY